MNKLGMPKVYDLGAGEMVELSYLEKVFGITRRAAAKWLKALHIKPIYMQDQVIFNLSTFKRIIFVLCRPGGPGIVLPSSKMKNNPRAVKNPEYLTEVTDGILEQAADPKILSEMAGCTGNDPGILKKFISQPVGRPPKESDE